MSLSSMKPRARDIGLKFPGETGYFNAITDVHVQVGYTTLNEGYGALVRGKGPIRTGVTAIFPLGLESRQSVFAGSFVLNGNGEMTGLAWVEESGLLDGPVCITNTHSVGIVRDSMIQWMIENNRIPERCMDGEHFFVLPVVAETADMVLNDMSGFHIKPQHVFEALNSAHGGPLQEGSCGGGTGMICHGWKGGSGTASRLVVFDNIVYTLGVFVQANHGTARRLTINGVPIGRYLTPSSELVTGRTEGSGSIITVIATDAPLLPHQLKRIAKRASLAVARTGGLGENGSGDLFLAFSTANAQSRGEQFYTTVKMMADRELDALFEATVDATEEAIINCLVAANDMRGANDVLVPALPHPALMQVVKQYAQSG